MSGVIVAMSVRHGDYRATVHGGAATIRDAVADVQRQNAYAPDPLHEGFSRLVMDLTATVGTGKSTSWGWCDWTVEIIAP